MRIEPITSKLAREVAEREHYMHRKPVVSRAFGLYLPEGLVGVCVCTALRRRVISSWVRTHPTRGRCSSSTGCGFMIECRRTRSRGSSPGR